MAFSPDGSILASASDDKAIQLWSTSDGRVVRTLQGHTQWVRRVAFSPNGEMIATGGQVIISAPELKLWRASDATLLHNLPGHSATIDSLAFAPDGATLASAATDQGMRSWRTTDGKHLLTIQHGNPASNLVFSPDGRLIVASHDKSIRFWSSENGEQMQALEGHGSTITCMAFSHDGSILASGAQDHTVRLWSVT